MGRAHEDDGPICGDPPCSSRLYAPKEDVNDQPPEEEGDIECEIGSHEVILRQDGSDDSSSDPWSPAMYGDRERGEEEGKVVDGLC